MLIAFPLAKCCFAKTLETSEENVEPVTTNDSKSVQAGDPANYLPEGPLYDNGQQIGAPVEGN